MKGFLSTAGTISTCGPSPSTIPVTTTNPNPGVKSQLTTTDVKPDVKKTPNLGLHRIAKLLGNDNKSNRPVESKNSNGSVDTNNTDRKESSVSLMEVSETKNTVQKKSNTETSGGKKWGRLNKGEIIIAKDLKCEVIKDGGEVSKEVTKGNSSDSGTDISIRCNGKLQRTKRIDQDGEGVEDKESLTSVTIISVPSNLMDAPITAPDTGPGSKLNNNPVMPKKGPHLKIESCSNNSLMKQASLPTPGLLQKHSVKQRCQTPNSGWL